MICNKLITYAVGLHNTTHTHMCCVDFIREMLEAFGFPAPFRAFIGETVYRDVLYRLKINGHVGAVEV